MAEQRSSIGDRAAPDEWPEASVAAFGYQSHCQSRSNNEMKRERAESAFEAGETKGADSKEARWTRA